MKNIFIKLIVVISLISEIYPNKINKNQDDIVQKMLKETINMVLNDNRNSLIYERVKLINDKIKSSELIVTIQDDKDNEKIKDLASFGFNKQANKPSLIFQSNITDVYQEKPTFVSAVLIHEFQHAFDYFRIGQSFINMKDNKIEKLMYELDAYHVEAEFIRDYTIPLQNKFTKFEAYLVTSYKSDYLASFLSLFQKRDMELIYQVYDAMYSKDLKTYQEKSDKIYSIYSRAINEYKGKEKSKSQWDNYLNIVKLITIDDILSQSVFTLGEIYKKESSPKTFDIKKYPEFNKLKNENNVLIQKNLNDIDYGQRSADKLFELELIDTK